MAQTETAPLTPQEGADIMNLQTEKSMELRKDVRKFAEDNPEIAAQMVKSWSREGMANERDSYRRGDRFSSCKTVDETAKGSGRRDLSWRGEGIPALSVHGPR
ncbi:MAG: hypothetical protein ACLRNQ_01895 [Flavonifractor plautii]